VTSDLSIDKALPTPAYLQLKVQLERAIASGRLSAGTALPSERDLADDLGLSRMTVRRAFEELVDGGLVEQRQGSGTYVRPQRLEQTIDRVLGFTDEVLALGLKAGSVLLDAQPSPADDDTAKALLLGAEAMVLRIARLRTADDEPLAIQTSHLIPDLLGLSIDDLKRRGSLYGALAAHYGVAPQRARQTVSARLATREERALLHIDDRTPVLALERITFDGDDRPFEFVRSAYRGDRYRLALDLRSPDR
jgi:GntR family transcriptional regulator